MYKVEQLSKSIGMVYSGMGPDYRVLIKAARKRAVSYELLYGEEIPTVQLVMRIAEVMQEYTQSGLVNLSKLTIFFLFSKDYFIYEFMYLAE